MSSKKALATISLGVDSKGLPKQLADARKKLRGFGADANKMLGKAAGGGGKVLSGITGGLGAGFGMLGASGIMDSVSAIVGFEKNLTRFQLAADQSDATMAAMRAEILRVSDATAVGTDEILKGAQAYFDLTGDVKGTKTAMASFAKIAQASGSDVTDIATAAAAMQDSLGIDASHFEGVFSGLISQGKAGAVSLANIASEITGLAPKFARFKGMLGDEGMNQIGAALQVAKKGFGSASEAATGLEALMGSLSQNAAKFEAAGVKIFDVGKDGTKTFKNLSEIVTGLGKSKLAKDPTLLSKALGSKEAEATVVQLMKQKDLFGQLITAGHDRGTVERDNAKYLMTTSGKIDAAMNRLKNTLADAFTPERIRLFSEALAQAVAIFAKVVGYAEKAAEYIDKAANYAKYGTTDSFEEQVDKEVKRSLGSKKAKGSTVESYPAHAAALRQSASNLYTKPGGITPKEEVHIAAMQKEADILAAMGDVWGAAGAKSAVPTSTLEDETARKLESELMGRNLVTAVADALRDGLAKNPILVKLNSTDVNKKLDNDPGVRTRGR